MAKSINNTISMLRRYINQTSDDSNYSDGFLYDILLSVRNEILPKELSKDKHIGLNLWKYICIKVCPDNFIPCDCIPANVGEYTVLKSKERIPNYLTTREHRYIQLKTIDNSLQIPYKTVAQGMTFKYKKSNNKVWFTIIDGYIYVLNHPTNNIKVLMLNVILEDPRDVILMSYCDTNGNDLEGNCYDSNSDTFSIPLGIENVVMKMVLQQLGISLQLPEDASNNTESSINKY